VLARCTGAGVRAALFLLPMVVATPASSQDHPPAPSAEDRKTAAQRFADGEKAYKSKDFARAAEAFEDANRLAPHPSASWNAARAWQRAGENARAANLYARYLREATQSDPDRSQSAAALAELSTALGRIEIVGSDLSELRVDQRPVDGATVYVNPGTHVVQAKIAGAPVTRQISIEAGRVVSVALAPDPAPPPASSAPPPATPTPVPAPAPVLTGPDSHPGPAATTTPDEPTRKGWHPAVFFVAGGLTLVTAGWTAWSGVDTLKQKKTFDEAKKAGNYDEAKAALDEGQKRQGRTNFLLGVTAAGAVFTAIAGIWFVGWRDPSTSDASRRHVDVGVGAGSLAVRGSF